MAFPKRAPSSNLHIRASVGLAALVLASHLLVAHLIHTSDASRGQPPLLLPQTNACLQNRTTSTTTSHLLTSSAGCLLPLLQPASKRWPNTQIIPLDTHSIHPENHLELRMASGNSNRFAVACALCADDASNFRNCQRLSSHSRTFLFNDHTSLCHYCSQSEANR